MTALLVSWLAPDGGGAALPGATNGLRAVKRLKESSWSLLAVGRGSLSESAPATAPAAPPVGLADSEPLPTPGSHQLLSFSRFTARNPFIAPGGGAPPASGGGAAPASGTSQLTNTAVIEVNGQSEEVVYGAAFPTADPVFRLANVTESGVEVGLASGSFDDGRQTVAIAVGEQVQLVGDNGTSYTVRVVSVDFKVPCVPGGSAEDCIGSG